MTCRYVSTSTDALSEISTSFASRTTDPECRLNWFVGHLNRFSVEKRCSPLREPGLGFPSSNGSSTRSVGPFPLSQKWGTAQHSSSMCLSPRPATTQPMSMMIVRQKASKGGRHKRTKDSINSLAACNSRGLLTPTLCANPMGRISTVRKSSSSTVAKRLSDTHRQQGSNRHPTIDDELGADDKG